MTFKRIFTLIIVLLNTTLLAEAQKDSAPYRMRTVVIDAGHGGHDPGNLGTGRYKSKEKDIALDVALRVGGYIKESFPDINVIYTRDTDKFIGLNERADVANKTDADLFISIHCNAATNASAIGVETFTLGLHKNDENLQVAMKENQAIFLEDDYEQKYDGFDPSSPESIIALTIMQSAFLEQSLKISSYIQGQFKERVGRRDRGVKQAGFLVLRRTTMPSILIELGFLTNPTEEDFLNSENGKSYMASAIFRGFRDYKERVEGSSTSSKPAEKQDIPAPKVEAPQPDEVVSEDSIEQEKIRKQQQLEAAKAEKERLEKLKREQDQAAKKKAETERLKKQEAEKLQSEKEEKERQLQEAKLKIEEQERNAELERVHREAVAEQARKDFAARMAELERSRQDSLMKVHAAIREQKKAEVESNGKTTVMQASTEKALPKPEATRDAETKKATGPAAVIPELADKPLSPEEAELLFLEKRKRELEERISRIKRKTDQSETTTLPEHSPVESQTKHTKPEKPLTSPATVDKSVTLAVQIMTSAAAIDLNSPRFKGEEAYHYVQDGIYKYVVGKWTSVQEATSHQRRLRDAGFDGAFVVAFKDGDRITLAEARNLLNE